MRPPSFWRRPESLQATALAPVSALYTAGARLRAAVTAPVEVPVPVLCVGNVVMGGAGKTPTARAVAALLRRHGVAAHFLSRGYKGALRGPVRVDPSLHGYGDVGDEPLLLAQDGPSWVAHDRPAGALAAVEAGAGAIVMDDGFQNPRIGKTLSVIVVDGGYGFGNGRVFPAGPLRESVTEGLGRADAVIAIGADRSGCAAAIAGRRPVLAADLAPRAGGPEPALEGQRAIAFAGIGRPEKFAETLRAAGVEVARLLPFPDHHAFTVTDLDRIQAMAKQQGAVPITTEKDVVRLPDRFRALVRVFPVDLIWRDLAAAEALFLPPFKATLRESR